MLRFEIVETESLFLRLAADWRGLCVRVPGYALCQTKDRWVAGLRHLSKKGDRLECLTVWDDALLVAVWPFQIRRYGLVRRLDLMGSGLGDYAEPLIDRAYETGPLCVEMLNQMARRADVLDLNFLKAGSCMHSAAVAYKRPQKRWMFEDFIIDTHAAETWDAFMGRYSGNMRQHLRSSRKKLVEQGALTFERALTHTSCREVIEWTLRQKQGWLANHNLRNDWYFNGSSREFLIDLANSAETGHYLAVFSLKLGDEIVAADICAVGQDEMSGLIIASDPAFHRFSPGMLIVQETARWAFDRKLAFGLMVNHGPDKARWANRIIRREAFQMALSLLGILYMAWGSMVELWRWFRRHLIGTGLRALMSPAHVKVLKAWLGRMRRPSRDLQAGGRRHEL